MTDALLKIDNLSLLEIESGQYLLENISFELYKGEVLGIFGDSGCGKSLLCKSILGLYPHNLLRFGVIEYFDSSKYNSLINSTFLQEVRGKKISIMFQHVLKSLNPMLKNKFQIMQVNCLNYNYDEILKLFLEIGLDEPNRIMEKYPHELSGGELTRFGLAMAILCNPEVLILDEAFVSIDRNIRSKFMKLLLSYARKKGISLIVVTHDPGVLRIIADNLVVMKNGRIIEKLSVEHFFTNPRSEYLKKLINAYENLYDGF